MTPRLLKTCLCSLFCAMTLCAPALAATPDYQLGYGDSLNITVMGQPNLSVSNAPIRPDGQIDLPLVQEVRVAGETVPELTADLIKAYRPYLAEPQIVVNIAQFRPLHVTLLGQVNRPGTNNFQEPPTLFEAIAAAGGLTDRAARDSIKVRTADGKVTVYDLDKLLGNTEQPPVIEAGAVIEVGEVWMPDFYRILPIAASLLTAGALLARP
ncbi:MAG TPA: polysaccharide biosynthesis/export family protein [Oscillatoriaceae cyanobacterium]